MKLLSRSDIERIQADERKVEIEQGLRIARRVDELRKRASEEENNLSAFTKDARDEALKVIDEIEGKKNVLQLQVAELEARREWAQKPLDAKWEEVNARSAEVERREAEVASREVAFIGREEQLAQLEERIAKEAVALTEHASALDKRDAAIARRDKELREAEQRHNTHVAQTTRELEVRESNVQAHDHAVALRKRDLDTYAHNLGKREKNVSDRERQVEDAYKTLLRTKNRG